MRPRVFLDVESTGLSIKDDRVIKITVLKQDDKEQENKGSKLINPGCPILNSDIHGLTDEMLREAPLFKDVAKGFHSFLSHCDLVGYNILGFDLPILMEEFQRVGLDLDLTDVNIIDLKKVYMQQEPRTLQGAFKHYTGSDKKINDIDAMLSIYDRQLEKYSFNNFQDMMDSMDTTGTVDIAGKIIYKDNKYSLTFGMHAGVELSTVDYSYIDWVLNSNSFMEDTKRHLRRLLK